MMHEPLRIATARYVLGLELSEALPKVADDALSAGIYSPSLAELATTRNPIMSDVGPFLEKAIHELGMKLPDREQAVDILLRFYISETAAGNVAPREGLYRVVRECYDHHPSSQTRGGVCGEELGIQKLVGYFYGYDDLEERPDEVSFREKFGAEAMLLVDEEVIREAKGWLKKHSLPVMLKDSSNLPPDSPAYDIEVPESG